MAKSIIKEIGIIIVLMIAVILILAVLLYEYIPNNKSVPVKIQAYDMPEDIKQELQSTTEEQEIVHTYYVDSSDLNVYESTNEYNKGKANPFQDYSDNTATGSTNNNSSGNATGNSSNNSTDGNNSNNSDTSNGDTRK